MTDTCHFHPNTRQDESILNFVIHEVLVYLKNVKPNNAGLQKEKP